MTSEAEKAYYSLLWSAKKGRPETRRKHYRWQSRFALEGCTFTHKQRQSAHRWVLNWKKRNNNGRYHEVVRSFSSRYPLTTSTQQRNFEPRFEGTGILNKEFDPQGVETRQPSFDRSTTAMISRSSHMIPSRPSVSSIDDTRRAK